MGSISLSNSLPITRLPLLTSLNQCLLPTSTSFSLSPLSNRRRSTFSPLIAASAVFAAPAGVNNSVPICVDFGGVQARNGGYTVGDFMTRREHLHVVKPSTSVDDALELLVEKKVTGLPVIDDDWNLVGVVSDYDLLALDSISGRSQTDANMFPNVDSTWKTFNELQKLISKTHGKVVGDLMTPSPLVVRGSTNLEDAARLLLETKFRRLPVVDSDGKLIGILTRGNVVRAALQIKRETENST
ncbi:CBS domain-containing protein CBSX2, chloroplastic isoform X1 [Eutrema salsugineum]|uniref:CBS domain-containing protein CBSX2, chloroplastic isoform X1 n=1 Tax=Eutrema salsugineum TaxID=72664 RepID=UPI000CECE6BF|nr:CBS domain-containing protein CBSX2, chloroplastic isoform X1 [Eutrema salsugineum]